MRNLEEINIKIKDDKSLNIWIKQPLEKRSLVELDKDSAVEHGEESVQIMEGCAYGYELPAEYSIEVVSRIVFPRPNHEHQGQITPGIYVGRLSLKIFKNKEFFDEVAVEVRSLKADYRIEYRKMLEDISEECIDLLMIHSSPVTQRFTVNFEINSKTIYQRFAFVKSIVDSDEFRNAVNRIISMPVTVWKKEEKEKNISCYRRLGSSQIRQLSSRSDRVNLPDTHPFKKIMNSVPSKITTVTKIDTVDTPENRFVKHALLEFQRFCGNVVQHLEVQEKDSIKRPYIYKEAINLEERFGSYLSHTMFKEISNMNTIPPLNSPVLQRKEGYRKILKVWLAFDLAAKLIWNALDENSYEAGKRDVASIYEHWVFFKLLKVVKEVFAVGNDETKNLISETKDGLGLQLTSGEHIAINGKFLKNNRNLKMEFSYNKSFCVSKYPKEGSWTQSMRPDYTISLWPASFEKNEAEEQELIIHIHFDAKYKVEDLNYIINNSQNEEDLNIEKIEQKSGKYKRADLLKMHAYKDAIRRTAGAYLIYPGKEQYQKSGFHEILPGLGAFPLSPYSYDEDIKKLKDFIEEVAEHFSDRASEREELSYYGYDVHKDGGNSDIVKEFLPEYIGGNDKKIRIKPVSETTVLVGYYNEDQYDWIVEKGLYNIRVDNKKGLMKYGSAEIGASYILLYGDGKLITGKIFKIISKSPVLMSKKELNDLDYPRKRKNSPDYYLVYTIERDTSFINEWNVNVLLKSLTDHHHGRPFAVSLSELMKAKVKNNNHPI